MISFFFLGLINHIFKGNMQIYIQSEVQNGKLPEWGLIEFQGSFASRDGDGKPIFNEFIGDLNYTNDGIPFFIIGHHILYGQEVKLQKPMAILKKDYDQDLQRTQYLVKAVIRRKILFKTRPKPIIAHDVLKNNV